MEGLRSWNLGLPHGDLSTVLNGPSCAGRAPGGGF